MDIQLIVDLNLPPLPSGQAVFPNLEHAVKTIANAAHQRWLAYAQGKPLPDGKIITPRSGAYLKSIQIRQIDSTHWEIFSDAPYAGAIEYGTGPYDLKQILKTSDRVRRTKSGKRYLIIPFRWGTGTGSGKGVSFGRQVMAPEVHAIAKSLIPSQVVGMTQRESGNFPGKMIPQAKYKWGGRLQHADLARAGIGGQQAQRMAGMVRFDNPGGKHSQYLTFRVMSEDSRGWIRPAQPGKFPAKEAVETYRPIAEQAFKAALQKDVDAILGG